MPAELDLNERGLNEQDPNEQGLNEQGANEQGETDRAVGPTDVVTASSLTVPAAPAFVMVGAVDAGLCVDGVCALPAPAPQSTD